MVKSIAGQMARQTRDLIEAGKVQSPVQFRIEGLVTNGLNYSGFPQTSPHNTEEALQAAFGLMQFRMDHPYDAYINALANLEYDYAYSPKH